MSPEQGLLLFLALTLILLGLVVLTGLRAQRRVHLMWVFLALVALGITIWFAERVGENYDLTEAGWIVPVHLGLAKATTLAYLLPLVTGVLTWRDMRWKPRHRWLAFSVLGLTGLTAATGAWMLLVAERL